MIPMSILDLVPVREGGNLGQSYAAAASLARCADELGYHRFWVAEHHAMEGIAGAATSVVLAHIGHATQNIRIGSGGIMLPNHNPFVIAEQFGTLEALFPGRVDLGLGRAPGADRRFAQALRKDLHRAAEYFPQDVVELRALLGDGAQSDRAAQVPQGAAGLRATPGDGANVEMWMLGSSLFGASLAAKLGLPYAFASHFAPDHLDAALTLYRRDFTPSASLAQPHVMVAMTVICADTDEEAEHLSSSQAQSFVRLRSGNPGKLPAPIENYRMGLPVHERAMLDHLGQANAIGSPDSVRNAVERFIERTGADELILSGSTYDPLAREKSLAMTMDALA